VVSGEAHYRAAVAAFPSVRVSEAEFSRAWNTRAAKRPIEARLAADVLVAAGIEAGDEAALRWLRAQIHRAAQSLASHVPNQLLADVESRVLELVAVATPERPARIRDYGAHGPLVGWLQVIVARTGRDLAKRSAPSADPSLAEVVLNELEGGHQGLETAVLRARLASDLSDALKAAATRLGSRERALLTLHYLRGVGLDEIGRAYQVHRATVSRWLVLAREAFLVNTRDELATRAKVGRVEVDSLVRALQGQLDISLRRVLESRSQRPPAERVKP
jgi:RNA polymerase sigma-70 factor (ECF subfamily)